MPDRFSLPEPPPPGFPAQLAPLEPPHLPQALAIEKASFPTPWDSEAFLTYILLPHALPLAAFLPGNHTLLGYACCWQDRNEMNQVELDIHNLAVHPDFRQRGLGRWLLTAALGIGRRCGAVSATLLVRPGNAPARGLYQSLGFQQVGVQPGYYHGEDALRLRLPLAS